MRSLFLRIFLSFWAAQALFLVLAILVTIALRPARHGIESQGPQILAEAVNAYQSGGERGVHDYLEELLHTQHVRAFVFDPSGHELSGRQVPPWIEDTRQGVPPRGGSSHGGFPHHHGWMDSLLPDRILRRTLMRQATYAHRHARERLSRARGFALAHSFTNREHGPVAEKFHQFPQHLFHPHAFFQQRIRLCDRRRRVSLRQRLHQLPNRRRRRLP